MAGARPDPRLQRRRSGFTFGHRVPAGDRTGRRHLVCDPEYNASIPGALKNALDWASRPFETNPFREKPVAVVGASQGIYGAIWAQAELRKVLRTLGARVDECQLVVALAQHAFGADGMLHDREIAAVLTTVVNELLDATCDRAA